MSINLDRVVTNEFQSQLDPNDDLVRRGILPIHYGSRENMDERICCLAGTGILLANGTEKPIEKLNISTPSDPLSGDTFLSIDGEITYPIALSGGRQPENWQFVEVVARAVEGDIDHSVVVTRTHAFATNQVNIQQAHLLKRGDGLRTIFGESIITSVTPVDSTGKLVWNLYLASENFVKNVLPRYKESPGMFYCWLWTGYKGSLLGLPPRSHMVFENGFLTGDLTIQFQLESLQRKGSDFSVFL